MTPALPPGFELDAAGAGTPPPPPGFELDGAGPPVAPRRGTNEAIPLGPGERRPVAPAPAAPPTFGDEVGGVVQAGINFVTQMIGGVAGMTLGPVAAGMAGLNEMGRRAVGAQPQDFPNALEAGGAIGHGVGETLRGVLPPDTPTGEKYTSKYVEPVMTGMQALTGHLGEMSQMHAVPGAGKQAADLTRQTIAPTMNRAAEAAGRGIGAAARKVANVDPELAKVAQVASELPYPIDVRPDQIIKDAKFSKLAGQAASDYPLAGSKNASNRENFTRNAINLVNPESTADRLTPDVFHEAMTRSGEGIGEITARTPVPVSDLEIGIRGLSDDLRKATEDNRKIVNEYVADIDRAASEGGGTLDGTRLKEINSQLGQQARANAGNDLGRYLNDLQDTIQDAVERNADPADIKPLRDFRRQYAYGKVLEPDIAKSIDGMISPSSLMASVTRTKQGKYYMARAMGGPIGDLARVGKLIKEPASSGTAERSLLYGLAKDTARTAAGVAGAYPLSAAYNIGGPKLTRAMIGKRPPKETPRAPEPPPEPTTTPGAGPGTPPPTSGGPGPLGDLTPDWGTTPGAGGGGAVPGIEPTGLHPAVGEPPVTTGNPKARLEIPAVPGRPDLPDTLVSGGPAETAATARANRAMLEPGAIEARAQQGDAAMRRENDALRARLRIPVGEATRITPEYIVADRAWRKEFALGEEEAQRATDVAAALQHDAPAVEAAARQFERSPRAFDREIERINEEGKARETQTEQPADGSESNAAATRDAEGTVQEASAGTGGAEPAGAVRAAGERPGTERDAAPAAGRDAGDAARGQAPTAALGERNAPDTKPDDQPSRVREEGPAKAVPEGAKPDDIEEVFSQKGDQEPDQVFYSPLRRAVDALKIGKGSAGDWENALRGLASKGVKPEEIEWSGVKDWLRAQGRSVTKAEVSDFLKAGGVRVEEVTKGGRESIPLGLADDIEREGWRTPEDTQGWLDIGDRFGAKAKQWQRNGDAGKADHYFGLAEQANEMAERLETDSGTVHGATKYSQYQLPGGTNYREVLLTLPERTEQYGDWLEHKKTTDSAVARAKYAEDTQYGKADYKSPHWQEPNVLAHIRLNDRTDAQGRKVLFVEEVQSDWAQSGKKSGFDRPVYTVSVDGNQRGHFETRAEAEQALKDKPLLQGGTIKEVPSGGPPKAPFVGNTSAWTALAIKRIAKMAADEGYDRVAFINGEQSASRYDLSKQIDHIDYRKVGDTYDIGAVGKDGDQVLSESRVPIERIEELVGKEVAQKIANGEGQPGGGRKTLRGMDLSVGGEGMKAFYDKIVPNVAKDVVRRLGGEGLTDVSLTGHADYKTLTRAGEATGLTQAQLDRMPFAERKALVDSRLPTQLGFDITDKMREQTAGGVPLFRRGEANRPVGTPERMEQALRDKFGDKLVQGLLDQGVLRMMLSADDTGHGLIPPKRKAVFRQGANVKPAATLYVDRVSAAEAPGILMHELGEHFGIQRVLGNERYALMLSELRELRREPEVRDAWATVKRNYTSLTEDNPTFLREVAAHLVENHPDLPFVRRLVNEIRAFFYEQFGTTLGNRVDANLIRGLAASALRKASKGDLPNMRRYVRFDGTPIPAPRPPTRGATPRPMLQ